VCVRSSALLAVLESVYDVVLFMSYPITSTYWEGNSHTGNGLNGAWMPTLGNSSATLYAENFDTSSLNQKPSGWLEVHNGDGKSLVTNSQSSSSPNSFRISCLSNWDGRYDKVIPVSFNSTLTIELKFKGESSSWFRPYFYFIIGNSMFGGSYQSSSGKINWANGSSGFDGSVVSKDTWNSVRIIIDKTTGKASYYLNGNLEASGLNPSTPHSNKSGDGFILASGNGGNGIVYYDDLSVTSDASVSPTAYSVSLSSNPTNGGTTTGQGNYNSGSNVTVTATANSGYTFKNWTESGAVVSNSTSYTFKISSNRNLVANFQQLSSSNPSIKPISANNNIAKGTEFWIEVKVGDPNEISDLFGLSFKLSSDKSVCSYVEGSAENGGFLGTGSAVLFFPKKCR